MTPVYISDLFSISVPNPNTGFLKRHLSIERAMANNNRPVIVRNASTLNSFKHELTLFHLTCSITQTLK